jgi:RNA ligase
MARKNRIVVDYGDYEGLVLLSAFDTKTGIEISRAELENLEGFDLVKKYDGIEDYKTLKSMINNNQEGFIIKFKNGNRIKIKGEEYLRLHKIMTNVSTISIWEVVKNGDDIEALLKDVPDEFYDKIKKYINELNSQYNEIKDNAVMLFDNLFKENDNRLPERKEYAAWVKVKPQHLQPVLFRMYDARDFSEIIWKYLRPEYQKL